jgi:hypothetical protein
MGLLSYVRDRKQVKASRAGEAREKLSAGDYSSFGGQNGASIDPFDPSVSIEDLKNSKSFGVQPANQGYKNPKPKSEVEPTNYPKNPDHSWDDENKDKFSDMPVSRPGTSAQNEADGPETAESEKARGARMEGSAGVTVLGPKYKKNGERSKIDADTRGRVRAANKESKRRGDSDNTDYLPSTDDPRLHKNRPKPGTSTSWDD